MLQRKQNIIFSKKLSRIFFIWNVEKGGTMECKPTDPGEVSCHHSLDRCSSGSWCGYVVIVKKPGSANPLTTMHVRFGRLTVTAMIGIDKSGLFLAGFFA